jgi:short subunit dehydrogenase-like uncharacterized protein
MTTNKEFDLIVFGATSFVGQILCDYLVNEYTEANLTWAMAARSESKLEKLRTKLGAKAHSIPSLIADSADENSLQLLCSKTSVIISTVGPYALYGELLVKVCAETGTDYCDLTGEAPWIRLMIERYADTAERTGARIVNSCGFDSIPSDLGVMYLQDQAFKQFGGMCPTVKMRVKTMKGGASGGTIASGINMYKEAAGNLALQAEMKDPYSLCPHDHKFGHQQHQVDVEFDEDFDSWVGSFIMEAINTRIVFRSNAIRKGGSYSDSFRYDEGTLTGAGKSGEKRAKKISLGTRLAPKFLSLGLVRNFLVKFVLPKPGEGPTKDEQLHGHYDLRFLGLTQSNQQISVKVTGDRDPGYGSTAKMLAQAAISLHRDLDKGDSPGGFWTPATVFNDKLLDRLRAHAGMTFELIPDVQDGQN